MLKDFLKNDIKVPSLCFHSMNQCGPRIVIYGGINSNDTICGDLYFIKIEGRTISCASYEKNKTSKINIIKCSLFLDILILQIMITPLNVYIFLEVILI